jgi:hypothetical protein
MADEPEQEAFPDPTQDPRIAELLQREQAALRALHDLNRVRREDDPIYAVPQLLVLESRVDALASMLVTAGAIDFIEFTGECLVRELEGIEQTVAAAREHKRQKSGLIVPPSANGTG